MIYNFLYKLEKQEEKQGIPTINNKSRDLRIRWGLYVMERHNKNLLKD